MMSVSSGRYPPPPAPPVFLLSPFPLRSLLGFSAMVKVVSAYRWLSATIFFISALWLRSSEYLFASRWVILQRLLGLLAMIAGICSSEWDSLQIVAAVESSTLRPHQISVRGLVGGILRAELSSNAYARVSRTKSSELRTHQLSVVG